MQPDLFGENKSEKTPLVDADSSGFYPAPFTPEKFGARYNRSASFGYRMIYLGRVKVLPGVRHLIPFAEVLKFEANVVVYNGRQPVRKKAKAGERAKPHFGSTMPKSAKGKESK